MSDFERQGNLGESDYLNQVLLSRPPLPVDQVDISEWEATASPGNSIAPGYAWERLPRWLVEIKDTYKRASAIPLVHLDLCSSLPLNAQMMRALEMKRSGEQAAELAASLYAEDDPLELETQDMRDMHASASGNPQVRALLRSGLQKVLYTLNSRDTGTSLEGTEDPEEAMYHRLVGILASQAELYESDASVDDTEARWQIKFRVAETPYTYLEELGGLEYRPATAIEAGQRMATTGYNESDAKFAKTREPAGDTRAKAYMDLQARALAGKISGNDRHRPARFISLDYADPLDIAVSSINNTPRSTRHANMFSHAVSSLFDPNQHVQGNILNHYHCPTIAQRSLPVMMAGRFTSSFEGMDDQEVREAADIATLVIHHWYRKLAYGGKLVIFPWSIKDDAEVGAGALRLVENQLSLATGHGISKSVFHQAALKELMSESDLETAEQLSGIFEARNEALEALIVEKPGKGLVDRHEKAYSRRMTIAHPNQD